MTPTTPRVSRKASSSSPMTTIFFGVPSASGNSSDSSTGIQKRRSNSPMPVPGPLSVRNLLSSARSMGKPPGSCFAFAGDWRRRGEASTRLARARGPPPSHVPIGKEVSVLRRSVQTNLGLLARYDPAERQKDLGCEVLIQDSRLVAEGVQHRHELGLVLQKLGVGGRKHFARGCIKLALLLLPDSRLPLDLAGRQIAQDLKNAFGLVQAGVLAVPQQIIQLLDHLGNSSAQIMQRRIEAVRRKLAGLAFKEHEAILQPDGNRLQQHRCSRITVVLVPDLDDVDVEFAHAAVIDDASRNEHSERAVLLLRGDDLPVVPEIAAHGRRHQHLNGGSPAAGDVFLPDIFGKLRPGNWPPLRRLEAERIKPPEEFDGRVRQGVAAAGTGRRKACANYDLSFGKILLVDALLQLEMNDVEEAP